MIAASEVRRVGAHLSISGGFKQAVESIVEKGGNCLQIFSGSPRGWQMKLPSNEEAKVFKDLCEEKDVKPIFIHAKYLINLGSDKKRLVEISKQALIHDLRVGEMIGAKGVIDHLGSHQGRGWQASKQQLVRAIKDILRSTPKGIELMIENSAGQKGKFTSQLEEIRFLFQAVSSKRLGWCLDSCHAWAAGYSLGKIGNSLIQNDIVKEAERLKILDRLGCVHVNDSRDEFGSGRDRHENLGKGKLGLEGLGAYVNHPQLKHLPMIIETPGFEGLGPDKKNLDILKSVLE